MKDLKVIIMGSAGSGKSTLASVISYSLTEYGYNVTVLPTDDKHPGTVGDFVNDLASNTNVIIEELQITREPNFNK